jgi:hypothetical protein
MSVCIAYSKKSCLDSWFATIFAPLRGNYDPPENYPSRALLQGVLVADHVGLFFMKKQHKEYQ